jgi:ABC-type sugar transport system ATPase subunit
VIPEKLELTLEPTVRTRVNDLAGTRSIVRVGVRPEHVKLVSNGGIAGTLYGAEDHGVEMILTINAADQLIRATAPSTIRVPVNAPVQIAFFQGKLHFFDPKTSENLANQ